MVDISKVEWENLGRRPLSMGEVVRGRDQESALWRAVAISFVCGILYYILARFPLLFLPAPDNIAAVWPASGLLIGALLVTPPGRWMWILLGMTPANFLANFLAGKGFLVCLGFLVSDIGVHSVVVFAVVRHCGAGISLSRLSDVGVFGLFIAATGAALSALGGAATALAGIGVEEFGTLWRVWCVSDFLGILAVAPPIIAWFQGGRFQGTALTRQGLLEGLIFLGALFAVSFSMFRHDVGTPSGMLMFPFLLFPPVVLLAFRLGLRGVSIGGGIISLMAFWGTLQGKGPFSYLVGDITYRILMLQGFLSILILSGLGIVAAISERKSAEAVLRASEERFRGLFDNASIGIYQITPSGKVLMANPALGRMLGFSSFQELAARPLAAANFRGEDAWAHFLEAIEELGEVRGREETWRTRDGGLVEVLENARAVRDEEGRTLYYEGTAEDITERKRARKALEESERLYRNAIEAAGAVPYFRDKHTDRYEFLGDRIGELVGVSAEDFNGPRFDQIIQETILLENLKGLSVEDAVEKVEREQDTRWRADYRIRRPDGEERWLSDAAVQVRDDNGEVIGSLGILTDTTDARRAEREIREALSRFEAIIENTPHVAIQGFDRDGVIRHWNSASETFYGHSTEAALGQTIQELLQMGDEQAEFERVLAGIWDSGESIPPREWTVRGREGEELCVYSTMFPIFSSGQVIEVFCMDVDITASKRAEEERRKLEAQIHHAQKLESLGVLAGGIAHDFNNLLMGVLGNASLALLELSPESPARESVAQIETAALRAADLAKQMLAYSGKGKFVVQRINLSKLVEEMSHLVEVSITKKAVLRYHFAENLPAIEADATQIRQVILNLITNASDALGAKSGIITVNTGVMEVDAEYLASTYLDDELPAGHYVYIEVSDTGCGMDEETRAKIFDPFFTTKFTGRGLGLAAVLGIVRGHKGAVKVYSQMGIGTTFKVLFPATNQQPEDPTPTSSRPREAWRATGTILVVDDEETVRVVSKRMLEACGLTVLCGRDGTEGVEMFREHSKQVTLVLLDMTMPRMSGEEAYREMRRIRPDVRIILTSGYNEQEATTRFAGKGLAGFIQKPFTHASLLDKVREVLESGSSS